MATPRLGTIIYTLIISGISLFGIWICTFLAAPRILALYADLHEQMVLPAPFSGVIAHIGLSLDLFWPCAVCVLVLAILALIPAVPATLRSVANLLAIVISVLLAASAVVLFASVLMAGNELYFAQAHRTRVFSGALEEFSLREAAENRMADVQRMAGLTSLVQKRIESVEELSSSERSNRLAQVIRMLQTSQSPDMKKKLLATLILFRHELANDKQKLEIVLSNAEALAGQSFSDSETFCSWLDQHLGKDGWDPIPLYTFTVSEKFGPRASANPQSSAR